MRIYTNLHRLNEDMAGSYRIRQQNFVEMQKNLDAVNSVLKSSIRLRGKNISFLIRIMSSNLHFFIRYFVFF